MNSYYRIKNKNYNTNKEYIRDDVKKLIDDD